MKIGFSFGRCIRDIVNGDVAIDDVAFIITATAMQDPKHMENVISVYMGEPGYLLGLPYDKCLEVAQALWDDNKLLQPRLQGIRRHMQPENAVWVDMFPTEHTDHEGVKAAWEKYRFMLHMVANVDNEAMDAFQ